MQYTSDALYHWANGADGERGFLLVSKFHVPHMQWGGHPLWKTSIDPQMFKQTHVQWQRSGLFFSWGGCLSLAGQILLKLDCLLPKRYQIYFTAWNSYLQLSPQIQDCLFWDHHVLQTSIQSQSLPCLPSWTSSHPQRSPCLLVYCLEQFRLPLLCSIPTHYPKGWIKVFPRRGRSGKTGGQSWRRFKDGCLPAEVDMADWLIPLSLHHRKHVLEILSKAGWIMEQLMSKLRSVFLHWNQRGLILVLMR